MRGLILGSLVLSLIAPKPAFCDGPHGANERTERAAATGCSITDQTFTNPRKSTESCTITNTKGGGGSCCGANGQDGCEGLSISHWKKTVTTTEYDADCKKIEK